MIREALATLSRAELIVLVLAPAVEVAELKAQQGRPACTRERGEAGTAGRRKGWVNPLRCATCGDTAARSDPQGNSGEPPMAAPFDRHMERNRTVRDVRPRIERARTRARW